MPNLELVREKTGARDLFEETDWCCTCIEDASRGWGLLVAIWRCDGLARSVPDKVLHAG